MFSILLFFTNEIKEYKVDLENSMKLSVAIFLANIFISLSFFDFPLYAILISHFIGILMISSFIDARSKEIPYICSFSLLIIVLLTSALGFLDVNWLTLVLFLALIITSMFGKMGGGDIQILLPIFLWIKEPLLIVFFLFIVAIIMIFEMIIKSIKERKLVNSEVAMAPYFLYAFVLIEIVRPLYLII